MDEGERQQADSSSASRSTRDLEMAPAPKKASHIAVALVTGATGGLGQTIAHSFAMAGYRVALHYRTNLATAQQARELCELAGQDPFSSTAISATNGDLPPDRRGRDEPVWPYRRARQ